MDRRNRRDRRDRGARQHFDEFSDSYHEADYNLDVWLSSILKVTAVTARAVTWCRDLAP